MRVLLVTGFLLAALATLAPAGGALSAPNCGVRHAGPGAPRGGSDAGALCILDAFQQHCRSASYRLSLFGVDTIALDSFSLRARPGGCQLLVRVSFEVVPQRPRLSSGICATLRRLAADIVAGGCVGSGLPRELSLTGAA